MVAKSISHNLRSPGMPRFPNVNTSKQWFPLVSECVAWIAAIRMLEFPKGVGDSRKETKLDSRCPFLGGVLPVPFPAEHTSQGPGP